jgi:hypothetical protein
MNYSEPFPTGIVEKTIGVNVAFDAITPIF